MHQNARCMTGICWPKKHFTGSWFLCVNVSFKPHLEPVAIGTAIISWCLQPGQGRHRPHPLGGGPVTLHGVAPWTSGDKNHRCGETIWKNTCCTHLCQVWLSCFQSVFWCFCVFVFEKSGCKSVLKRTQPACSISRVAEESPATRFRASNGIELLAICPSHIRVYANILVYQILPV